MDSNPLPPGRDGLASAEHGQHCLYGQLPGGASSTWWVGLVTKNGKGKRNAEEFFYSFLEELLNGRTNNCQTMVVTCCNL